MKKLIKNAKIVNEGVQLDRDILINKGRIIKVSSSIEEPNADVIDAMGMWVIPGIIDDQVHFREPGLTHKASIFTESRAAAAGGVTSFMEMPNVYPPTLTQDLLDAKYALGASQSLVNYSFFMGVSNDNLEEALRSNPRQVCGLKIFMGSSTGNMLVDDEKVLDDIFSKSPMLIATHCEDEATIRKNTELAQQRYGADIPFSQHPHIRSVEACYLSSSKAIELALKYDTRLHILHISTSEEIDLFSNRQNLRDKRITSEVCVHHLSFDASQYEELGSQLKCNPAIKEKSHQDALWQGLLDNRLDIIATDHAPHTWSEKQNNYLSAPSGLPLVQHSLNLMLLAYSDGKISMEKIVEKMCHAPAECFRVTDRGYIREGYFADLVIIDPELEWRISQDNIRYKCGWSPLQDKMMKGKVVQTLVNGEVVFENDRIIDQKRGERLSFDRDI